MKKIALTLTTVIFLFGFQKVYAQHANSTDTLPKIAILGTFHFAGTNDLAATTIDSIFSEKRQQELEDLTDKISRYQPTKILIEWEPKYKTETDEELNDYLEGNFTLKKNEVYQIGFRLAEKTGIKELYPIDYPMNLGDSLLEEYIVRKELLNDFQEFMINLQNYSQQESEYLKNNTLLDYFKKFNSDEADNWNRNLYLEALPKLSNETANPILEFASNWYKRNIFIMGEIDNVIEKDDRILVLIGSGHRAILKELYSNRSNVEYVEIKSFLE